MSPVSIAQTIRRSVLCLQKAHIPEASLEARLLLEHALERPRAWALAHPATILAEADEARLDVLVARRTRGEPMAYILGQREFFGISYYVDSRVLIPRPETEVLVERVLDLARHHTTPLRIVDVGTGSGAIALTLAHHLPLAQVIAVDCSRDALNVAISNAHQLGLEDRVSFVQGDLLTWLSGSANIIVANLPYIPTDRMDSLPQDVREHEPHGALDGGPGGLTLNLRLIQQASSRLMPGDHLLAECEPDQISRLAEAARSVMPGSAIESISDGYNHARFIHIKVPT
ncbi:MAG: peptide chain release factor N(5)-glutamine methyltransferase [Chloroflexota bacterium]